MHEARKLKEKYEKLKIVLKCHNIVKLKKYLEEDDFEWNRIEEYDILSSSENYIHSLDIVFIDIGYNYSYLNKGKYLVVGTSNIGINPIMVISTGYVIRVKEDSIISYLKDELKEEE